MAMVNTQQEFIALSIESLNQRQPCLPLHAENFSRQVYKRLSGIFPELALLMITTRAFESTEIIAVHFD